MDRLSVSCRGSGIARPACGSGIQSVSPHCAYAGKEINGVRIKCLNDPSGPFSFFGWIFMNPAAVKEDEISEILTHEWRT